MPLGKEPIYDTDSRMKIVMFLIVPEFEPAARALRRAGVCDTLLAGMTTEQRTTLACIITVDDQIMHSTPCFTGTRVPVQTLIDFLETGEAVDAFLTTYPCMPREQGGSDLSVGSTLHRKPEERQIGRG